MLGGFVGKLFGGFVVVVLAAGLLVYFYALPGIERQLHREVERRVAQEAQMMAELVSLAWDPALAEYALAPLEALAERLEESRITIIDATGVVLYDSHRDAATMDNHLGRAEVQELGAPVTRFSDTLGKDMVYQASPVRRAGATVAYARVAVSTEDRDARAATLRDATRRGVLVASLISLLLAFIIARLLSRPLTQISAHVEQLGKGGTRERLLVGGGREFSQLASSLNTMAEELELRFAMAKAGKVEREAILSAMADGVVAVDASQRVLFINGAACRLLDVSQEDPVGQPIWELSRAPGWNELVAELNGEGLADQAPSQGECRLQSDAGELILEVAAVGFDTPGVARRGTVFVLRDVTELQRLEAVRRDFISNVSHELKTPLTAMRGYLDVVLDEHELEPSKQRRFLQRVLRNTLQLGEIVSDLLSLSRLESEEHNLRFAPQELGELLELVEDEAHDLAESHRIQVHYDPLPDPLYVVADQQALKMALLNLVTNAIRYSGEGTTVEVRAFVRQAEEAQREAQAVLEVRDQGPGIPADKRERIFERFFRIDKARTRSLGGTGLGLAIVRHVMASHGGSVELESELGQGSVFRLLLPVAEVPSEA